MSGLLPDRHPNKDFFILDVTDASPKDDLASMEHPVFSLSVKPDMRDLEYEHGGKRLRVVPSGKGLATIMDKDIVLYCISKLVNDANRGEEISPWVELNAHEAMVATNWNTGKRDYKRFEEALVRLRGTTILTDITTGGEIQTKGFGLIDAFEVDRKDKDGNLSPFGRLTKVRIKVSDWTFKAVQSMEVLTISPQYFRLRRPLERRLYEIARKHAGDQERPFIINLDTLQKKVGSNSPAKKFRYFVKQIVAEDHMPDYKIEHLGDKVSFTRRTGRQGDRPDPAPKPGPRIRFLGPEDNFPLFKMFERDKKEAQEKAHYEANKGSIHFERTLDLAANTFEIAKKEAPGYDVYALYEDWKAFCRQKGESPKNPDGAFIGFCKKKHAREPLA